MTICIRKKQILNIAINSRLFPALVELYSKKI